MNRLARFLAAGLLLFPGCGGSSSPTAPPATTLAPAPVTTVLDQGSQSDVGVNILYTFAPFTTTATGTLDVTVDWTFAQNNIQVYLAQGQCTLDQVNQKTCVFAGFSESATAKPEKLHLTNLAAGTYSLMVGNRGPSVESFSFQIVFTK